MENPGIGLRWHKPKHYTPAENKEVEIIHNNNFNLHTRAFILTVLRLSSVLIVKMVNFVSRYLLLLGGV